MGKYLDIVLIAVLGLGAYWIYKNLPTLPSGDEIINIVTEPSRERIQSEQALRETIENLKSNKEDEDAIRTYYEEKTRKEIDNSAIIGDLETLERRKLELEFNVQYFEEQYYRNKAIHDDLRARAIAVTPLAWLDIAGGRSDAAYNEIERQRIQALQGMEQMRLQWETNKSLLSECNRNIALAQQKITAIVYE